MEKVYLLILRRKKLVAISTQTTKEQIMVFDRTEEMDIWLRNNGFVYGHCNHFANKPGIHYWFHLNDTPVDFIDVDIQEHEIFNQNSDAAEWIQMFNFRREYLMNSYYYSKD